MPLTPEGKEEEKTRLMWTDIGCKQLQRLYLTCIFSQSVSKQLCCWQNRRLQGKLVNQQLYVYFVLADFKTIIAPSESNGINRHE